MTQLMSDLRLAVSNVAVRFEGVTLLRSVSFQAEGGQSVAIVGPNGAGKTTLLRVLAGRINPTEGEVRLSGELIDDRSPQFRAAVSSLIGVPAFYDDMTIENHLELASLLWDVERAQDVLAELEIESLAKRYMHELSSGQRQMAQLAFALARPSRILLLDEPEQRLDKKRRQCVAKALARRAGAGAVIVMATHDRYLTDATSSRLVHVAGDDEANSEVR